jgi:type VI protein secretion system component VasK
MWPSVVVALEVDLPAIVAIALGVFWLGVLITVGWTVWRLLANLKSLLASMNEMSQRLAPTLEELATRSQETAELTARLQQRQALRQRGGGGGGGR